MKKSYTILAVALVAISASAQLDVTIDNVFEAPCEGSNKGRSR
jgi:predicted porin